MLDSDKNNCSTSDQEECIEANSSCDTDSEVTDSTCKTQMRVQLPNLAKEADRFGISDCAAASLATAVLVDFGIVTQTDQSHVIDKNKVRRERHKLRKVLQKERNESVDNISSIYFDGRKIVTRFPKKKRARNGTVS
jgi:hypothetical protein